MMKEHDRRGLVCEELRRLGYASQHRERLYGDEFDLVSNPFPDGSGYAVGGISRNSDTLRRVPIPLSIVQTIERELFILAA